MIGYRKGRERSDSRRPGGRRSTRYSAAIILAAVAAVCRKSSAATTLYWDANNNLGGSGPWDTTDMEWNSTGTASVPTSAWVNGDGAVFGGTAGMVTVGSGGVSANGLTFTTIGYTLSGGAITLTGSTIAAPGTPGSTVGSTSLVSVLAGSVGASYTGAGSKSTIVSSGLNTYTGATTISTGYFLFSYLAPSLSASSFGSGSDNVVVANNSSFAGAVYIGTGGGTTDRLFTINGTSTSDEIFNSGTGALSFTSSGSAVGGTSGARAINLGGTYSISANTFAESISDMGGGTSITSLSIATGNSKWIISNNGNSYTGATGIGSGATLIATALHALGNTSVINMSSGTLSLLSDAATATFGKLSDSSAYSVMTSASGAIINVDELSSAGASVAKTMTIGAIGTSSVATSYAVNFTGNDNSSLATGAVTGAAAPTAGTVTLANSITGGTLTLASYSGANVGGGESLILNGVSGASTVITGGITTTTSTGLTVTKGATSASTVSNLTIQGASNYTGGTIINNKGTLTIGMASSLGTGAVTFNQTGTLAASGSMTFANNLGNPTSANTMTLLNNNAALATTFQASGLISGAGNVNLASTAGQTSSVSLTNDSNSFTGTVSFGFGTFSFTSVASGGTVSALGAATSAYMVNNGGSYATLQYIGSADSTTTRAINWNATGGNGQLALDASGVGTVQYLATSNIRYSGTNALTLTLLGTNTGANTLAQVINDSGGATSFVKSGVGSWVLTGANTYTGGTTISAGTLTAASTGTSSAHTFGTGNVSVTSNGALVLSSTGGDFIADTASLLISSSSVINLSNTTSESVAALSIGSVQLAAGTYSASQLDSYDSNISGTGSLTVIPEPATTALLGLGACGLLGRRRRRKC